MSHYFDIPAVGVILISVLALFVASVIVGILASFRALQVAASHNFNHVATVIAGLVLTVASGALGMKPGSTKGVQPSDPAHFNEIIANPTPDVTVASVQIASFRGLYTVTYLVTGFGCLIIFVLAPKSHNIVRTIGLTTLGFGVLIVSTMLAPTPPVNVNLSTPPSITLEPAQTTNK